jgi:AbrB family looped-hinge helix DNA binding protein
MRISERGQVTIPKALRERYGLKPNTEVEFIAEEGWIGIRKRRDRHPVWDLVGIVQQGGSTDAYIERIRGRAAR